MAQKDVEDWRENLSDMQLVKKQEDFHMMSEIKPFRYKMNKHDY